ncbi:MAG TPA: peptidylprolyl isomerase [Thermofilum sp.]|nr:peptidylprolyl isomerase [Thermofilum sp.]
MPIEKGDFVLLDYTLRIKEENKVIDTTIREIAEKHEIKKERFEPRLVILGEGNIPKGLEDELIGMEEGSKKMIEVSPEKGFGKRDPKLVKVYSARLLANKGIIPRVGMEVEIEGKRGLVLSVGGGRVIVDLNHPLAGKTLIYEVKIVKVIKGINEKVKALLKRRLGDISDKTKVFIENEGKVLRLDFPFEVLNLSNLGQFLSLFLKDINKYLPNISVVRFVFEHVLKKSTEEGKEIKTEKGAIAKAEAQHQPTGGDNP